MASPGTEEEDVVLGLVREALRADGGAAERVAAAGRAAWTWRTVDAELAELTRDSARTGDGFALQRDGSAVRTLVFEGSTGSVEVQVDGNRLVGQLVPPVPGRVQLSTPDGPGPVVQADDIGCFALDLPDGRPWRLRCTRDTDALVTAWIDT